MSCWTLDVWLPADCAPSSPDICGNRPVLRCQQLHSSCCGCGRRQHWLARQLSECRHHPPGGDLQLDPASDPCREKPHRGDAHCLSRTALWRGGGCLRPNHPDSLQAPSQPPSLLPPVQSAMTSSAKFTPVIIRYSDFDFTIITRVAVLPVWGRRGWLCHIGEAPRFIRHDFVRSLSCSIQFSVVRLRFLSAICLYFCTVSTSGKPKPFVFFLFMRLVDGLHVSSVYIYIYIYVRMYVYVYHTVNPITIAIPSHSQCDYEWSNT